MPISPGSMHVCMKCNYFFVAKEGKNHLYILDKDVVQLMFSCCGTIYQKNGNQFPSFLTAR